jgi:hypothetical protein
MKGSGCDLLLVLSHHFPGGTEEYLENSEYSRSPGRDLNLGPSECTARVLTSRP